MWRRYLIGLPVLTAACAISQPEITRGLPASQSEADKAFDRRVKERFPVGTAEKRLVQELEGEGFVVTSHGAWKEAKFTRNYLVVETVWSVRWRASGAIVAERIGLCFGSGM